jgi:TolB-like protein
LKKFVLFIILLVLIVFTVSSQQGELLAILIFKNNSNISPYISRYYPEELYGLLTTEFFKTNRFRLIERPRINEVIYEQKFQESNMSDRQIQNLGKILGVKKIITGECVFRSGTYSANVRLIDVQTGMINKSVSCSVNNRIDMGYFVINLNEREMMQYLAEYIVESILENY